VILVFFICTWRNPEYKVQHYFRSKLTQKQNNKNSFDEIDLLYAKSGILKSDLSSFSHPLTCTYASCSIFIIHRRNDILQRQKHHKHRMTGGIGIGRFARKTDVAAAVVTGTSEKDTASEGLRLLSEVADTNNNNNNNNNNDTAAPGGGYDNKAPAIDPSGDEMWDEGFHHNNNDFSFSEHDDGAFFDDKSINNDFNSNNDSFDGNNALEGGPYGSGGGGGQDMVDNDGGTAKPKMTFGFSRFSTKNNNGGSSSSSSATDGNNSNSNSNNVTETNVGFSRFTKNNNNAGPTANNNDAGPSTSASTANNNNINSRMVAETIVASNDSCITEKRNYNNPSSSSENKSPTPLPISTKISAPSSDLSHQHSRTVDSTSTRGGSRRVTLEGNPSSRRGTATPVTFNNNNNNNNGRNETSNRNVVEHSPPPPPPPPPPLQTKKNHQQSSTSVSASSSLQLNSNFHHNQQQQHQQQQHQRKMMPANPSFQALAPATRPTNNRVASVHFDDSSNGSGSKRASTTTVAMEEGNKIYQQRQQHQQQNKTTTTMRSLSPSIQTNHQMQMKTSATAVTPGSFGITGSGDSRKSRKMGATSTPSQSSSIVNNNNHRQYANANSIGLPDESTAMTNGTTNDVRFHRTNNSGGIGPQKGSVATTTPMATTGRQVRSEDGAIVVDTNGPRKRKADQAEIGNNNIDDDEPFDFDAFQAKFTKEISDTKDGQGENYANLLELKTQFATIYNKLLSDLGGFLDVFEKFENIDDMADGILDRLESTP
jgi:hypothetical protein